MFAYLFVGGGRWCQPFERVRVLRLPSPRPLPDWGSAFVGHFVVRERERAQLCLRLETLSETIGSELMPAGTPAVLGGLLRGTDTGRGRDGFGAGGRYKLELHFFGREIEDDLHRPRGA